MLIWVVMQPLGTSPKVRGERPCQKVTSSELLPLQEQQARPQGAPACWVGGPVWLELHICLRLLSPLEKQPVWVLLSSDFYHRAGLIPSTQQVPTG